MKKLAYGFLAIGIVLVVLAIGLNSFSNLQYKKLINDFENNTENIAQLENIKDSQNNEKDKITEDMIGLIKIPSIDLKYPILEGIEDKVLKKAVGHFEVSALPGEEGNMTLIGHNNFILSEPFKDIDRLSSGDLVTITTSDKDYTYQVIKTYTVDPYNKDIVKQGDETKLTLVTCTDDANKRFVVEALLQPNVEKDAKEE